ncbi:hypothetical protein VKT23_020353 [Stygiomarasmius scandens]|uniref:Uncharacterized protein n=1 Tax=Marasmiellus scandens TaxID=2682957 RepID=A0ABR1IN70_9AGAR
MDTEFVPTLPHPITTYSWKDVRRSQRHSSSSGKPPVASSSNEKKPAEVEEERSSRGTKKQTKLQQALAHIKVCSRKCPQNDADDAENER